MYLTLSNISRRGRLLRLFVSSSSSSSSHHAAGDRPGSTFLGHSSRRNTERIRVRVWRFCYAFWRVPGFPSSFFPGSGDAEPWEHPPTTSAIFLEENKELPQPSLFLHKSSSPQSQTLRSSKVTWKSKPFKMFLFLGANIMKNRRTSISCMNSEFLYSSCVTGEVLMASHDIECSMPELEEEYQLIVFWKLRFFPHS